jgi:hypothetical protein
MPYQLRHEPHERFFARLERFPEQAGRAVGTRVARPEPTQTAAMLPRAVSNLLPSAGVLRAYVEDAYPLSEAPAEAHLIAALITASALAGKKLRISPWQRSDTCRFPLGGDTSNAVLATARLASGTALMPDAAAILCCSDSERIRSGRGLTA